MQKTWRQVSFFPPNFPSFNRGAATCGFLRWQKGGFVAAEILGLCLGGSGDRAEPAWNDVFFEQFCFGRMVLFAKFGCMLQRASSKKAAFLKWEELSRKHSLDDPDLVTFFFKAFQKMSSSFEFLIVFPQNGLGKSEV